MLLPLLAPHLDILSIAEGEALARASWSGVLGLLELQSGSIRPLLRVRQYPSATPSQAVSIRYFESGSIRPLLRVRQYPSATPHQAVSIHYSEFRERKMEFRSVDGSEIGTGSCTDRCTAYRAAFALRLRNLD